ncbi:enoyl-CoA hydratase/isomerase family protein [Sphingomonas sp. SRS2]|uniref:enoyl-CoA hydratase/isomerase family protein n=1 Tax=Sphingomonas sp. SRS2 TaxID=133190 RepID=UPI0006184074|nr:enoyl-CoA hydratase/isomerase family protein [Sphingomonas sp. SRS2]KKC25215.1 hypothetical protein WP12_15170 [Sphingomonas sp. SRS2]
MSSTDIVARCEDGVGELILNRPKQRNALSIGMQATLMEWLARWAQDDDVRAVVLRGEAVFSSGLDRKELFDPEKRPLAIASSKDLHRCIATFPKPIVAAIEGYALATAFDIAAMCDIRIAATGAQMGKPEIRLGAAPVVTPLRWIVGDGWARDLSLTGRLLSTEEAFSIGFVTRVVPPHELADAALATAREIAAAPLDAIIMAKGFFLATPDPESWLIPEHDVVCDRDVAVRPKYIRGKLI